MQDRHDPMLAYALTALSADRSARASESRATFGRLEVDPNGTNAIPSEVRAWLDARACDEPTLQRLVGEISTSAVDGARSTSTGVEVVTESTTDLVEFDLPLRARVATAVARQQGLATVPLLPTAAGHDAGILASAGVPTAMLFVRNPTGVSHSPAEHAETADCHAGVAALAAVLTDLAR
jgi:N-carbamoyl-L-amino-acid hydrolase